MLKRTLPISFSSRRASTALRIRSWVACCSQARLPGLESGAKAERSPALKDDLPGVQSRNDQLHDHDRMNEVPLPVVVQ